MKLFFSFKFGDHEDFICSLATKVKEYVDEDGPIFDVYFDIDDRVAGPFQTNLQGEIVKSAALVFFIGQSIGPTQREELEHAIANEKIILPVYLPSYIPPGPLTPEEQTQLCRWSSINIKNIESDSSPAYYAKQIRTMLRYGVDGLPHGYPFSYEKEIIAAYLREGGLPEDKILAGCPREWPEVKRTPALKENPVPPSKIGHFRDCWDDRDDSSPERDPRVLSAALTDYHLQGRPSAALSFPEAGPRKRIAFSKERCIHVGILVSGGIAPGVNAVLAGLIKRQVLYADKGDWECRILLYREGFKGLASHKGHDRIFRKYHMGGPTRSQQDLNEFLAELDAMADTGGSYMPTARSDVLLPIRYDVRDDKLETVVRTLKTDGIDVLYIIGGDGSMKAAHAIQTYAERIQKHLAVVAIPKTMDNDVLWVWQSFGFPSAVQWAKNAIRQLYTEAKSNPRLCVVQLFGSDSGFVVSHAALASGVCDCALIPEDEFDLETVTSHILERLQTRRKNLESPYGIVLTAETAFPRDATQYINIPELTLTDEEKNAVINYEANGRRIHGQITDELRSASMKIISGYLKKCIRELDDEYWKDYRVFANEPRHLVRSVHPSVADIVFGERLGSLAVDGAMAGYKDFMISQWLTEYVLVPLKLVVLGRKRIPTEGIFWHSVVAKTGQDEKRL